MNQPLMDLVAEYLEQQTDGRGEQRWQDTMLREQDKPLIYTPCLLQLFTLTISVGGLAWRRSE